MGVTRRISKLLSANDTGETGAHQAGILVPKASGILSFFPTLDPSEKNPRIGLDFYEEDDVTKWRFEFIYYNNKLFGGTRNEYRLTWMTEYLRSKRARAGDVIYFELTDAGRRYIQLHRATPVQTDDGEGITLKGGWTVIKI